MATLNSATVTHHGRVGTLRARKAALVGWARAKRAHADDCIGATVRTFADTDRVGTLRGPTLRSVKAGFRRESLRCCVNSR